MNTAAPATVNVTPMSDVMIMSRCINGSLVVCDPKYAPTANPTPMTISATPARSSSRSRDVDGSRSRMSAISCLNWSTLAVCCGGCGCCSTVVMCTSRSEIGSRQLVLEFGGLAHAHDSSAHHDGRVVRDPQDSAGELLHDEDRHALAGNLGDDLVQLLDDDRREAHRQLVEQQQRRIRREAARHREHLLLAARERARGLSPALS